MFRTRHFPSIASGRLLRLTVLALGTASPLAIASAQEPVALLLEGDPIAGVGHLSWVNRSVINRHGTWVAHVDTNFSDPKRDEAILRNGDVLVHEGTKVPGIDHARFSLFVDLDTAGDDQVASAFYMTGISQANQGVFYGKRIVVRQDDLVNTAPFPPQTTWEAFKALTRNSAGQIAIEGRVNTNGSGVPAFVARLDAPNGVLQETTILARQGQILAGASLPVLDFGDSAFDIAINEAGQVVYVVEFDPVGTAVYKDAQAEAMVGDPSPAPGEDWTSFLHTHVAINNRGDTAYWGSTNAFGNRLLVANGELLVRDGDTLADFAPWALESNFAIGSDCLSDAGELLWWGRWSDPDFAFNSGLFIDHRILVQIGVTEVDGALFTNFWQFNMSPTGRHVLLTGRLDDGRTGLFHIDRGLGVNYCGPAVPNSTGLPAQIEAIGRLDAAANDVRLNASELPLNTFGYFLVSKTQGFSANPGGSQGNLCLGGLVGRMIDQVQSSGMLGWMSASVDLSAIPPNQGAIVAGDTWNFQAWYRDNNPGPTSNFTDAVAVTFE